MGKRVLVIWNDQYHPADRYGFFIDQVFTQNGWHVETDESIRRLLLLKEPPDLTVSLTAGKKDGEPPLKGQEQLKMVKMVKNGMGWLFIHAGLTGIERDAHLYELSLGRFVSHPPEPALVTGSAMPGTLHPIVDNFTPFTDYDEQYFCQIDLLKTQPFFCTLSNLGTEIGGWSREVGSGRVACLTPGHTEAMLAKMIPLIRRAAAWCVHEL